MSGVNSVPVASINFLRDDSRPRNDKPSLVHLPTEIWLMVMEYLLPINIKDLSLASRAFRSFTIPSLFSKLVIIPETDLPDASLEKLESRLTFYTSVAIAPFVRTCILGSCSAGAIVSMATQMGSRPRDAVVFTYLPRLFNLRTFVCESAELDRERIETLRQLHQLKSVNLHRCGLSDTLKDTMFNTNWIEKLTIVSNLPWPFLTNAACHLRELHLTVSRKSLETYIPLLYHCPRLETLVMKAFRSIHTEGALLSNLPVPSLPMLKVFRGTASYTAFISGSGCSLHDVSLYRLEDRTALQVLAGAHAQHLRSLNIAMNFMTAGMLEPMRDLAALETLVIEIWSFDPLGMISTRADLVDALTNLVLPPKLQSIRVGSDLFGDEASVEHDSRRLERMKDQNEGLTYLGVDGNDFSFVSQ